MNQRSQQPYRFKFSPSLLNTFSDYIHETGYESEEKGFTPFVTFQQLIDRINRVAIPTTEAQQKGKNFEDVVFGKKNDHDFKIEVVEKVKGFLPSRFSNQVYVELPLEDTLIYGYADGVGEGRVFDIKTTSRYEFPKYLCDHQNLYLLSLKDKGVKVMDYIITNFNDVFGERYSITDTRFDSQFNEIELFKMFLEENRNLITDKKIFGGER